MIAWWNNMDLVGQIFALIAIPSTLVLLVQTLLVLFGGESDMDDGIDLNGNGQIDTPVTVVRTVWRCSPSAESWQWLLWADGADL